MSSTPNGPKGGDSGIRQGAKPVRPALDQTFLGVAPPVNPPPGAAPNPASPAASAGANPAAPHQAEAAASQGSAIIAAPMISLSGAAARAAAPAPSHAPQPGLAVTVPPVQLGGGWESANVMPRPGHPDRTLQQGTPRALVNPAAEQRSAYPQPSPTSPARAPEPRGLDPRAVAPRADLGTQNGTALASDYLRQARDAVLGARLPEPGQPQGSSSPPRAATPAQYAGRAGDVTAPSVPPGAIAQDGQWPRTAELPALAAPEAAFVPRAAREQEAVAAGGFQAAPLGAAAVPFVEQERFGTQASVAPPPLGPAPEDAPALEPQRAPLAPPPVVAAAPAARAPMAPMAPVPAQLHSAPPRSLAGTMLEPPPSTGGAPSPRTNPGSSNSAAASRFEQVPPARVPLAEQGTGAFQIPIDQSLGEWNQGNLGQTGVNTHTKASDAKGSGASQLRLIGLALVAVLAIGFASFGDQLLGHGQKQHGAGPRPSAPPNVDSLAAAALENPNAVGTANQGTSVSATTASLTAASANAAAPSSAPTTVRSVATAPSPPKAAGPAVTPAEAAESGELDGPADSPREKAAAAERTKTAEAHASPEELASANAARNVITGRYGEALPLYQELARSYPQNTAYAVMVRVLKQKTESSAPAVAPQSAP